MLYHAVEQTAARAYNAEATRVGITTLNVVPDAPPPVWRCRLTRVGSRVESAWSLLLKMYYNHYDDCIMKTDFNVCFQLRLAPIHPGASRPGRRRCAGASRGAQAQARARGRGHQARGVGDGRGAVGEEDGSGRLGGCGGWRSGRVA